MQSIRSTFLAAAVALTIAPAAFAQEGDGVDSAAGKRVSIVGGYALTHPTGDPTLRGSSASADGEGAPTLGVTYHVTDNIGIEAWASDRAGHRLTGADGRKLGSIDAQPYSLSGQYRFGSPESTVRPFVGLGYHETNYSREVAQPGGAIDGQRLGVETAKGAVGTVGVDVNFNPRWFARADARYFQGTGDIHLDGAKAGEAKLNPVVLGVGIGARF